ncbi:hypothetical protein CONLIGDRAFT_714467 [Coniochaeta ligniaria NRRL 30616]|uniref:RRM domain-containing protein n=1 Tax=Coniochaeta ligniaria NRRL 30616 TaxID=1408157 RepID=A0A1J7J9S3_9PEZI|nr:hypothetical protein CONLIGDRAFT_714467 [Coniochaeta ligniaria NRRL 30616]
MKVYHYRDRRCCKEGIREEDVPESYRWLSGGDELELTVFVGGLSGYVTEDELRSFFQGFGEITCVKIPSFNESDKEPLTRSDVTWTDRLGEQPDTSLHANFDTPLQKGASFKRHSYNFSMRRARRTRH